MSDTPDVREALRELVRLHDEAWIHEDADAYTSHHSAMKLAWANARAALAAADAVPNEPTLEQLDDPYLLGGCTEGNCQLCRTPKSLRKVGMQHAGIGAAPMPPVNVIIKRHEWQSMTPEARRAFHEMIRSATRTSAQAAESIRDTVLLEQNAAALRADLETYRRAWNDSDAKVASLRAELDAAKADAERYRWLRENASMVDMVADPDNLVQIWTGTDPASCSRGRTLDTAIDAAMGKK